MSFTSYEFIAFLAAIFLLYYLIPKRFRWMLLLAGSTLFYAWAGLEFLLYIFFTALTTWGAGLWIGSINRRRKEKFDAEKDSMDREAKKAYKAATKRKTRWIFLACLLINLGILAVIKYSDFVIQNINDIFDANNAFMNFAVPLGISYYTFKSMGYLIDINRGKYEPQKNPAKFALFVSFFPQVIQGPISRYDYLSQTLFEGHDFNSVEVKKGFVRVLWGFCKKLVIADRLVPIVKTLAKGSDQYQGAFVLLLIFLYAIQLYADFTGGIDIAIGIGEMLGIRSEENFITPYFSKNINEYWTRWHITMGSWFKDYIFYPISVSKWMLRLSKNARDKLGKGVGKRIPVYLANIIVWFATGLWHGAAWNFIVWGMLNCVVTVASYEMEPLYGRFHNRFKWSNTAVYNVWQMIRTFWIMGAIRILDVYRDVPVSFSQVGSIFTTGGYGRLFSGELFTLGISAADFIVVLLGIAAMLWVSIVFYKNGNKKRFRDYLMEKPFAVQGVVMAGLLIIVLVFGAYGIGYDANAFIYNQF